MAFFSMIDWNYNLLLADADDIDWGDYIYLLIFFGIIIFNAIGGWLKKWLQKNQTSKQGENAPPSTQRASSSQPLTETQSRPPQQRLPVYARGRTQQAPPLRSPASGMKPVSPQPSISQPTIRQATPRPIAPQPAPRPTISSPPPRPHAAKPPLSQTLQPKRTSRVVQQPKFRTAKGVVQQVQAIIPSPQTSAEPLIEAVALDDQSTSLSQRLKQRDELVNAIVMAEILGKPLALRDKQAGGLA